MFILLTYIFFLALYLVCPFPAQLIIFLINLFVPDPVPCIDEIVMVIGLIKKWEAIEEFKDDHPILFWIEMVVVGAVTIYGLTMLIRYIW